MSIIIPGSFPARRLRRSRTHSFSRRLVAENQLTVDDLILPVFIIEGQNLRQEVPSMPGVFRLSVDMLLHDAAQFVQAGIPAIALFPCIESSAKSLMADASWDPSGLVPRAVRALKKAFPELCLLYTSDAADERSSVALGGRRVIEKKKKTRKNTTCQTMYRKRSYTTGL